MEDKLCSACGGALALAQKNLDLGGDGWGPLSLVLSEPFEVDAYVCSSCGKIELYQSQKSADRLRDIPDGPLPSEADIRAQPQDHSPDRDEVEKGGLFRRKKKKPDWEL